MPDYQKVRKIGAGSFGAAWLVKDKGGKEMVMKVIDMSRMNAGEKREANNEVRVLSSLKHPYIVSFRESFLDSSSLCIVMDFAEGGDLYGRIEKTRKGGRTFPEPTILRWMSQATLALKHMHDRHILHRDLKSQNMFLAKDDILKIGDFGISKMLDNTAACARTTIGTPYYLSPEICQERPYSWASDIWALGCILFELCALKVPFDAPNIRELVKKITRGPTPVIPGRFSHDMRQLVADLLERDCRKRPPAEHILQRPIIQSEIRQMLKEHSDFQASGGVAQQPDVAQTPSAAPVRGDESDNIICSVEIVGGRGVRQSGKTWEHRCRPQHASGSMMRLGRNHQLAWWKEVTRSETCGYISRDQFEVAVAGVPGNFSFTITNSSSAGLDVNGSRLASKGDSRGLSSNDTLVLNAGTDHEVRLRFIAGSGGGAPGGEAVMNGNGLGRPPMPNRIDDKRSSPQLAQAGREMVARPPSDFRNVPSRGRADRRSETPGRALPWVRADSAPRIVRDRSASPAPSQWSRQATPRQASPAPIYRVGSRPGSRAQTPTGRRI